MRKTPRAWLIVASLCWLGASPASADQAADEAAIRKNVEAYAAAFNKQDAKTLAEFWLPEAIYVDPESGKEVVGREAIEKHFAAVLAGLKNAKLSVAVVSIKFVSPHVAVEIGTSSVLGLEKEPVKSSYTAIHVKRDGKWLLDRVTEEDVAEVKNNYDKLKDLEWMVGTWVDDEPGATVEVSCKWSRNQNFLVRTFSISDKEQIDSSGVQFIGWDPVAKQVRSWVFDSNGGFGEAVWIKKGQSWQVSSKDTLANGQKASSVTVITFVDKNTFKWQSVDRQVGGRLLPNLGDVKVIRKPLND